MTTPFTGMQEIINAHIAEMMFPPFSTYKLGINPDLNHLPPSLTPSDMADIFDQPKGIIITDNSWWCDPKNFAPQEQPKGTMPIETMPEETMIPPINIPQGGVNRFLSSSYRSLAVHKDSAGYHVMDDGVRRPVKVTWNGHFAESELIEEPKAPIAAPEPDELVVELRRIADALETLANVTKGTTPSVVVNPGVVVNPE